MTSASAGNIILTPTQPVRSEDRIQDLLTRSRALYRLSYRAHLRKDQNETQRAFSLKQCHGNSSAWYIYISEKQLWLAKNKISNNNDPPIHYCPDTLVFFGLKLLQCGNPCERSQQQQDILVRQIAQWIERRTLEVEVRGSEPMMGTCGWIGIHLTSPIRKALRWQRPHYSQSGDLNSPEAV